MDVPPAQSSFQLIVPKADCVPDLLGVWQTATASVSADDQLICMIELPVDPVAAAASLARQSVILQVAQQDLRAARLRLDTFANHARRAVGGAASFTSPAQDLPAPERELAAMLQIGCDEQSFTVGEQLSSMWREIAAQAHCFLGQVQLSLARAIHVKTAIGGVLIGQTTVGLRGDLKTIWRREVSADQIGLHRHALALAFDSRAAWMHAALHIVAGAAHLATLFALPGGAYLAIPAVWQFIKQVLANA